MSSDQQDQKGGVNNLSVLGEMAWLYSHSELHRNWAMGSIHQWLLPAIFHGQYRLYRKGEKPMAFVSWGYLSKEVEEAYVRNTRSLQPKDWKSGERIWFLDWVAPFGGSRRIASDLKHNVFPNDVGRFLRAKPGDDTLRIFYVHGANALDKARDWDLNPTVELSGQSIVGPD